LGLATKISLRQQRERLRHSAQRLESSSLSATLKRGYAILQQTDGRLLTSAQATRASNMVTAQFHDGAVTLEVKK
jgi:exonuclease VII large subunit